MEGGGSAVAAALVAQQMRGEEATPTALRNFQGEEVDQQVQEKRRIERDMHDSPQSCLACRSVSWSSDELGSTRIPNPQESAHRRTS